MIKVMQISSDTNIGGAGKCILTYLKNDDKGRFENILVLPKGSKLKEEAEKIGVRIIEFDGSRDKSLEFSAIAKFKKLFWRKSRILFILTRICQRGLGRKWPRCQKWYIPGTVFLNRLPG